MISQYFTGAKYPIFRFNVLLSLIAFLLRPFPCERRLAGFATRVNLRGYCKRTDGAALGFLCRNEQTTVEAISAVRQLFATEPPPVVRARRDDLAATEHFEADPYSAGC